MVFLLCNNTLLKQGKRCYTHAYHSRPYFLSLGQARSVNISSKLQNRSRGTEVSVNLLGSTGSFSWMVKMGLSSFGFIALPCCPAGLHVCVDTCPLSCRRALETVTRRGWSAEASQQQPFSIALPTCSVSHVWPLRTFFVNENSVSRQH